MFHGASAFNQPLNWNVTSTENVNQMFRFAEAFNQSLATWNLQSVRYIHAMFHEVRCSGQKSRPWPASASLSGLPPRHARGLRHAPWARTLELPWPLRGL